jgi:hypothetical protein
MHRLLSVLIDISQPCSCNGHAMPLPPISAGPGDPVPSQPSKAAAKAQKSRSWLAESPRFLKGAGLARKNAIASRNLGAQSPVHFGGCKIAERCTAAFDISNQQIDYHVLVEEACPEATAQPNPR